MVLKDGESVVIREDGLLKYPSTIHLEGSRLQENDKKEVLSIKSDLMGKFVVIEEKLDGANSAISFSDSGNLQLQSRGHFLLGGSREKQYNLLKSWAQAHVERFFDVFENRYIVYGEWMYAKHSMFYDALPHYFVEFDIFDKQNGIFLNTRARHELIKDLPIVSVPVLYQGEMPKTKKELLKMIGPSLARTSNWKKRLELDVEKRSLSLEKVWSQTDKDENMEGLYFKFEDEQKVLQRGKFVRSSFTQTILDGDEHWSARPIIPNQLKEGVDIYAPEISKIW